MIRSLKVYLDTSVPSAYYDERNMWRQSVTQEFWLKLKGHQVFVSDMVIEELEAVPDEEKKRKLLDLIKGFDRLSSQTYEIKELAEEYAIRNVIPIKHIEDAFHLAAAAVNDVNVLISWNFEHVVKLKTKREINVINVLRGYSELEIIDPEMF